MKNPESGKALYRPLRVFAFDPSQGKRFGNYITVKVDHEDLKPGPRGKYLAVVDFDVSNQRYYDPVDLNDPTVLLQDGLDPSESNPHFHQQMVYAVASETIRRFEFALGRKIRWAFRGSRKDGRRLRLFPHAMQEANAYYDRELRAIVFGYFSASATDPGSNLPGQTVFTCLSHDIIVHETTHALIDGQRAYFMDPTGPDTVAFHEAFADLVALFQHFSFRDALLETIQATGGMIHRFAIAPQVAPAKAGATIQAERPEDNPLVGLAKQFGEAMGMRKALRSALGTPPGSQDLEKLFEPHARGAILVAAVFDAFFTVYFRRVRDLLRLYRNSGAPLAAGDIHPDLAKRLAEQAAKTASHFCNICIRALDYCPPVDINFGDFLRALLTADYVIVPDDDLGYRAALVEAFRSRGIRPEYVNSYSEESLLWWGPQELHRRVPRCKGLEFNLLGKTDPKKMKRNAEVLNAFATANAKYLGLSKKEKIAAHSYHPLTRIGPDGQLRVQFVAELMQRRDERLDKQDKTSPLFTFRGGSTVVFDSDGVVRYAIQKNLDNKDRLERQREYLSNLSEGSGAAVYSAISPQKLRANFGAVHRGC